MTPSRENFASKLGAILAAAGSAVGLGNIWRFPIETGRNGGAAFILIYIGCIFLIGLPVMLSEFVIGRSSQSNTAGAYRKLAPGTQWKWVGRLGVFTGFIIMSYYVVVAGWTIEYAWLALSGRFIGRTTADFPVIFNDFATNPWQPVICLILFVLLTHLVIVKGVTRGIEKWSKLLMPLLFGLVMLLVVCAVCMPGAKEGVSFLLKPDFSKVNGTVVLNAMGQAFYSLSLGMGCLCTYASYFNRQTSLAKTALNVCVIDTVIALMAGFIIFPAASAAGYRLQPGDIGASLLFITLPNVFQQAFAGLPVLSYFFSLLFYLLIILAALTSTISLHEVVTSYMSEEFGLPRRRAALAETLTCIVLGCLCSLSFGPLKDLKIFGMTIFDLFDWTSSNLLLPIGGMFISLFVGWYLDRRLVRSELTNDGSLHLVGLRLLIFILRFVAPIAILAVLLNQLHLF